MEKQNKKNTSSVQEAKKGCGKEFMKDYPFGLKDGQGFAPRIRRTCGLGVVGEEDLCSGCSSNLNKENSNGN